MNKDMAGQAIYTSAPQAADYSHSTDTGKRVQLVMSGRVHVLREVQLTDDSYLAEYQFNRYGSFMGVTWTAEQLEAERTYPYTVIKDLEPVIVTK